MITLNRRVLLLFLSMLMLYGCEGVLVTDTQSLLAPRFTRSEVLGLVDLPGGTRRRTMNAPLKPASGLEGQRATPLLDVLIRAGLIFALATLCYRIFSPFLTLTVWAVTSPSRCTRSISGSRPVWAGGRDGDPR